MRGASLLLVSCLLLIGCASGMEEVRPVSSWPEVAATRPGEDPYAAGKAHLRAGQLGLAVESFRMALRRDPQSVDALNGLAVAYDQMGRVDVASTLLERALSIDPGSTATLNNMARSLLRQNQPTRALAYLERARAASPDNPTVLANLRAADEAPAPEPVVVAAAPEAPAEPAEGPRIVRVAYRESLLITTGAKEAPFPQPPAVALRQAPAAPWPKWQEAVQLAALPEAFLAPHPADLIGLTLALEQRRAARPAGPAVRARPEPEEIMQLAALPEAFLAPHPADLIGLAGTLGEGRTARRLAEIIVRARPERPAAAPRLADLTVLPRPEAPEPALVAFLASEPTFPIELPARIVIAARG
jgi:tetratricopeptide (TPR) repeat protein